MPASAGNATQTYAYNHPDITFPHGTWVDEGHFKVADSWASWLKVRLVANSIAFTYGTGPDHSLFDVYVGGSLWQSVDGYATERGEATLTIPLRYDGPLDFEIRNREEKNLQSTGYVVRFKQVQATSKLASNSIAYTYDGLARLLLADYGATQYEYGFDVAGNLVNMNGTSRTFNTANQMTHDGTNTLTYDANGNMINDGVNAYTWDRANRLLSHGGLSYVYDGMGNRVSQDNGTDVTSYLLDVQPSLAKVIGANQERYSHDMHGVHTTRTNANERYWSLPDGLGSIRAEASIAGTIVGAQNFDPYGVVQNVSGNLSHDFAFTGEPLDGNDLQYHRARYYDTNLGIFPSLDPFEGMHNRPMSLNGYSWVEGNTPNLTDASGRCVDNMVLGNLSGRFLLGNRSADLSRLISDYSGNSSTNNTTLYQYQADSTSCCGPDATRWLHQEIANHWEYALTNPELWITPQDKYALGWSMIDEGIKLVVYGLAVDYGYVDYRMLARLSKTTSGRIPRDNEYSCSNSGIISVCGRCQNSTDFGNFILGIVIHAAGFSKFVAEMAGVIFNSLSGDTTASADNQGVIRGFEYSQLGLVNQNYNRSMFCSTLNQMGTNWHDTIPSTGCSTPCTEQNLDRAPHSLPHWNAFVSRSTGSNNNPYITPFDWLFDLLR